MSANDKSAATYGPGRTTPALEARVRLEVAHGITNISNWPEPIQVHLLGRDLAGPINKLAEALLPLIADAWEEGYGIGGYDYMAAEDSGTGLSACRANPYRRTP